MTTRDLTIATIHVTVYRYVSALSPQASLSFDCLRSHQFEGGDNSQFDAKMIPLTMRSACCRSCALPGALFATGTASVQRDEGALAIGTNRNPPGICSFDERHSCRHAHRIWSNPPPCITEGIDAVTELHIGMFGKLTIGAPGRRIEPALNLKAQELLAYLLVHRNRDQTRDVLAELLWGDATGTQSKKNLRQALWKLRSALDSLPASRSALTLIVHDEWVRLATLDGLQLDINVFEDAFARAQGVAGACISDEMGTDLERAVRVYDGPFLENWFHDWCIVERERLERMLLIMLSKLLSRSEASHRFDAGLAYGRRILQHDRAHERTHQALMRLYYRSGDRTLALRQFEICRNALHEELDVEPSHLTRALYEQIRADHLVLQHLPAAGTDHLPQSDRLIETMGELRELEKIISSSQDEIRRRVRAIHSALHRLDA